VPPRNSLTRRGRGPEGVDAAIKNLPSGHNFIEALAGVIADASLTITDLPSFLKRFGDLSVSCSTPFAAAAIGGLAAGIAHYSVPHREIGNRTAQESEEFGPYLSGIHQDRRVFGTAIMLLGSAFREGKPRYANARKAYLAGFGTTSKKASTSSKQKINKIAQ
jgi:hypothetical protein